MVSKDPTKVYSSDTFNHGFYKRQLKTSFNVKRCNNLRTESNLQQELKNYTKVINSLTPMLLIKCATIKLGDIFSFFD